MSEFRYAKSYSRPNSRTFVWIAKGIFWFSLFATIVGLIGAVQLQEMSTNSSKRLIIEYAGWAIEYIDSYFLMTIISIIWIQVCSVSADTEQYLISLERKVDELLANQSDQNQNDTTIE